MERLRIGLFIDTYFPMVDGVVIAVHNYALELSKYADVMVFAPFPREKDYRLDVPYEVIRCKKMKIPLTDYDLAVPNMDKKFRRILKHSYLDIVHVHSPFEIGKAGIKYAKKYGVPVITSLHSQIKKDFLERTKSKFIAHIALNQILKTLHKSDYYWAVNHKVADIFKSYGLKVQPEVHFNGTDLLLNTNMEAVDLLKRSLLLHGNEKIFLYVGRIDFIKNLVFLIDSLKILFDENFRFQMVFVGTGPHQKELEKRLKKAGLSGCVHFTGRIMDRVKLSTYYRAADLFLFPSKYDSSSLVQIEAASQKTPTLFLKDTATADTITPEVNGYVANDDIYDYANKIKEIFDDQQSYNKVCEQAYHDLYHRWKDVVYEAYEKYLEIIKECQGR